MVKRRGIQSHHRKDILLIVFLIAVILALIFILMYTDVSQNLKSLFNNEIASDKGKVTQCNDLAPVSNDYFTQDSIQIKYELGAQDLFGDYCKDALNLVEYGCNGTSVLTENYLCDAGCYEGACISPKNIKSVYDSVSSSTCKNYHPISPVNAIARSQYGSYSPLNAIDNDLTTRWYGSPKYSYPRWIYFDLGNTKCISQLDLYEFSMDLPIRLKVQASHDTAVWITVKDNVTLSKTSTLNIEMPSNLTARYIRIVELSGPRPYGGLADIRFMVADPTQ